MTTECSKLLGENAGRLERDYLCFALFAQESGIFCHRGGDAGLRPGREHGYLNAGECGASVRWPWTRRHGWLMLHHGSLFYDQFLTVGIQGGHYAFR